TDTHYGKVWLGRMVMLVLLAALQFKLRRNRNKVESSFYLAGGLIISASLVTTISLSGHAAAAEGSALVAHISADALHLLASGVWLGGLVPLFVFLRNCARAKDVDALIITRETTRRYSRLAMTCV